MTAAFQSACQWYCNSVVEPMECWIWCDKVLLLSFVHAFTAVAWLYCLINRCALATEIHWRYRIYSQNFVCVKQQQQQHALTTEQTSGGIILSWSKSHLIWLTWEKCIVKPLIFNCQQRRVAFICILRGDDCCPRVVPEATVTTMLAYRAALPSAVVLPPYPSQ